MTKEMDPDVKKMYQKNPDIRDPVAQPRCALELFLCVLKTKWKTFICNHNITAIDPDSDFSIRNPVVH